MKKNTINIQTRKLLNRCKKANYTRISIETRSKKIPYTMNFPFGVQGSIFAWPCTEKQYINCWPAIWEILREFIGNYGCGNSHQHDLPLEHGFQKGLFILDENGKWNQSEGCCS